MIKLFNSIYKDYDRYKISVGNVLGHNSLFVEEVISDKISKLHDGIVNGSIRLSSITNENGSIKPNYFHSIIIRGAIDHIRKKKLDTVELKDYHINPDNQDELNTDNICCCLMDRLNEFEKSSTDNKFHATVFKYKYLKGISINKLSLETNIPRSKLTASRDLVLNNLKIWEGQERKRLNQMD